MVQVDYVAIQEEMEAGIKEKHEQMLRELKEQNYPDMPDCGKVTLKTTEKRTITRLVDGQPVKEIITTTASTTASYKKAQYSSNECPSPLFALISGDDEK